MKEEETVGSNGSRHQIKGRLSVGVRRIASGMGAVHWGLMIALTPLPLAGQSPAPTSERIESREQPAKLAARSVTDSDHRHEYARLRKARLEISDFEMQTLSGETIQLREELRNGKLVLLHFFATFCHNSNYDVQTVNGLYRAYRSQGLVVIGICEYSTPAQLERFVAQHRPEYPIVIEGAGRRDDREQTLHYRYRRRVGDTRYWGTPFNLLLEKWSRDPKEEIVTRRVKVATGELIQDEVEALLRRRLGGPR
jgi:hypothetical protein